MRRYVSKLQLGLERKRNEFDVVASTFDASMLCYDTCTYRITRFDDDERFEYDGCRWYVHVLTKRRLWNLISVKFLFLATFDNLLFVNISFLCKINKKKKIKFESTKGNPIYRNFFRLARRFYLSSVIIHRYLNYCWYANMQYAYLLMQYINIYYKRETRWSKVKRRWKMVKIFLSNSRGMESYFSCVRKLGERHGGPRLDDERKKGI